jgi:hypothetical protein
MVMPQLSLSGSAHRVAFSAKIHVSRDEARQ